jgi:hypothetical protein
MVPDNQRMPMFVTVVFRDRLPWLADSPFQERGTGFNDQLDIQSSMAEGGTLQ